MNKAKVLDIEINTNFTVPAILVENLPSASNLKHQLNEVLAEALDLYLNSIDVTYREVHALIVDGVYITDEEED
tara:strand:+ start:92 stop:313 length:222 start_codon:yes stop_codon:yes gene_type:complete